MSETSAKLVFRVPCPEKKNERISNITTRSKKINDRELKCLEDKFYLNSLQFQFNTPKLQSTFIFSKIFSNSFKIIYTPRTTTNTQCGTTLQIFSLPINRNSHPARQRFVCHGYKGFNGKTRGIELSITYFTLSILTQ